MKFRVGRLIAGAVALAAAASTLTVGTAHAGPPPPSGGWDHSWSAKGVKVYAKEYGDWISVCDTSANGSAAKLEVTEQGTWPYSYQLTVSTGANTCKTVNANSGAKYNLAEGKYIDLAFYGTGADWTGFGGFKNDN